jgi:PAS domain S-box-containing protein
MPIKQKELGDLWITVSIMISFTIYHLIINLSDVARGFLGPLSTFPEVETVAHGMYLWMMGLLYISHKRWREALKKESELNNIMSCTGPAVVLIIDSKRTIKNCNDSIEHVFGFASSEVIGQRTEFLYGDRRTEESVPHEIYSALERVGFHVGEAIGNHKNGTDLFLEIITAEKKGEGGAVLLIKDITERKRNELAVLEAKEAAEKAYREKQKLVEELEQNYARLKELESTRDTLTHMIVHDMKTPLQVLAINADLLEELAGNKLDDIEMKSLNDMRAYCTHLDVMMKSMLDVSRMEGEQLPLSKKFLEPGATLENSIRRLGALKNRHTINVTADKNLPVLEYGQELVERVLLNFFINAIKYSKPQTLIQAEVRKKDGGVIFSVSDRGCGIPPGQLKTVFKKFGQAYNDGSRLKGSTGLGLTFCRLAVEAHGGEVGVQSDEGAGSTFWFSLPASLSQEEEAPEKILSRSVA